MVINKKLLIIAVSLLLAIISMASASTSFYVAGEATGETNNVGFAGLSYDSQPIISSPDFNSQPQISMGVSSSLSGGSAKISHEYTILGNDLSSTTYLKSEYFGTNVEDIKFNINSELTPTCIVTSGNNIDDISIAYSCLSKASMPVSINAASLTGNDVSFAQVINHNQFYCENTVADPQGIVENTIGSQENPADSEKESSNQVAQDNPAESNQERSDQESHEQSFVPQEASPKEDAPDNPTKSDIKFVPADFDGDGQVADVLSENLGIFYNTEYGQVTAAGFDYDKSVEANDIKCTSEMLFAINMDTGAD